MIWADVVRALAIYLVVLVHSLDAAPFDQTFFSTAVSATCVPLFVILSGALLLQKKESYRQFYQKRFVRLVLPWLTWTLVYMIVELWQHPVFGFVQLFKLFSATLTSFWFLPMIVGLYLITPALRILVANAKPKDILFLCLLWFLSIGILPYYRNTMAFPFFVDDGIVRQVFTYLGYYLLGAWMMEIKLPSTRTLFLGFFLGIGLSIANFILATANHWLDPHFSFNYIFPGTIIASASLFAIIKTSFKFNELKPAFVSLITSLSMAALGIYFIHGLLEEWFLHVLGRPYLFKMVIFGEWINSLTLYLISFLIILALTRVPFLKRFVT